MADVIVQKEMSRTEAWLWNENKELMGEIRRLERENIKLMSCLDKSLTIQIKCMEQEAANKKEKGEKSGKRL